MSTESRIYGDRYELTGPIASGGMAEVFMARDKLLDRPVAIKTLHPQFARDASFVERFRREAQAAAKLADPRIVSVYDWGSDNGTPYIVMEYVEGKTLRDIIQSEGPLTPERAVEIAADVCGALQVAHGKGLVHRDVKPANIAITRNGQTKVMDFGIARAAADSGQTMTQTGTVMGTASYLSPEQAQGLPVDPRSDVYSLGVVLYEMLTQEVPFKGDTAVTIAYKHVKEDPVPPRQLNPEVSAELDAVVMKALAKNPDNRYSSAQEMRLDLQRLLRGEQVEATPLLPPDQTVALQPRDRTTVMPVPALPATSPKRKALAYVLIFSLFLSIIVLGIVLLFSLFGGGAPSVAVPNVVGKPQAEATKILEGAGLNGKVVEEQFSESVPDGSVISQDPEDGRKMPEGSDVNLVVSKGPERVEVPELVGKTRDEAAAALEAVGLDLGAEQQQFDNDKPPGTVLSQNPRAGEKVEQGSSVDIVVSGGKETVTVPNVTGLDESSARERILDAGLNPVVRETCNKSQRDGVVLDQNPEPLKKVDKGTNVTITVNATPKVPLVVGQTESAARSRLESAGFKVEVNEIDVPGDRDEVVTQDPAPGETACKGSTVTITVEK